MCDDHTGIRAEASVSGIQPAGGVQRPPDGFRAELPALKPGCFRVSRAPHRGELLLEMAVIGLALSFLSVFPFNLSVAILALPLSLLVSLLARRDLARMRLGVMDPSGEVLTETARRLSFVAILASIVTAVVVSFRWHLFFLR